MAVLAATLLCSHHQMGSLLNLGLKIEVVGEHNLGVGLPCKSDEPVPDNFLYDSHVFVVGVTLIHEFATPVVLCLDVEVGEQGFHGIDICHEWFRASSVPLPRQSLAQFRTQASTEDYVVVQIERRNFNSLS